MISARILLISPAFFGYEGQICDAFRRRGAEVDYFDERPSNTAFAKALVRAGKPLLARRLRSYFREIYKLVSGKQYDLVLVIKGEVVPSWFLAKLRNIQPCAKFIFYSFDAIRNSPNCLDLFPYFDKLYSFDFLDVQNHRELQLKHLFYTDDFAPGPPLEHRRYDIAFVGTLHSARYSFVQHIFRPFRRTYGFFYVQAPWFYYVKRLTSREFRRVTRSDVSFQKLRRSEVAKIFRDSRAILDMQRNGQTGLTMRTFEVLASGAILVTSNPFIKQTEFYDPQRVIVLPSSGPGDPGEFAAHISAFSGDGRGPNGFSKQSLDFWVGDFLDDLKVRSH